MGGACEWGGERTRTRQLSWEEGKKGIWKAFVAHTLTAKGQAVVGCGVVLSKREKVVERDK